MVVSGLGETGGRPGTSRACGLGRKTYFSYSRRRREFGETYFLYFDMYFLYSKRYFLYFKLYFLYFKLYFGFVRVFEIGPIP